MQERSGDNPIVFFQLDSVSFSGETARLDAAELKDMKLIGIIVLGLGLIFGAHALTMDVGVDVPARDFGYGISTPAMKVANLSLMNERQNYLIFGGVLSVVGAVLTAFGSMRASGAVSPRPAPISKSMALTPDRQVADGMKLCPYCAEEIRIAATKCKHCQSDLPVVEASVDTGSPHIKYSNGIYTVGGYSFDTLEEAQKLLAEW